MCNTEPSTLKVKVMTDPNLDHLSHTCVLSQASIDALQNGAVSYTIPGYLNPRSRSLFGMKVGQHQFNNELCI